MTKCQRCIYNNKCREEDTFEVVDGNGASYADAYGCAKYVDRDSIQRTFGIPLSETVWVTEYINGRLTSVVTSNAERSRYTLWNIGEDGKATKGKASKTPPSRWDR